MLLDTLDCRARLMETARRLLTIDSPSGFTRNVVREVEQIARDRGYAARRTNKGNLIVSVPGREKGKKIGLCAHIDTLGLMVRSITGEGMLMTTRVGGPILPTLDGEYCKIYTRRTKMDKSIFFSSMVPLVKIWFSPQYLSCLIWISRRSCSAFWSLASSSKSRSVFS